MLQRMQAEVFFLDRADLGPGSAALVKQGFDIEVLDKEDDYEPAVFAKVTVWSELDEVDFLHWVAELIEPAGGDVVEAGLADPPAGVQH
jgi:hypothetical protein